MRGAPAIGVLAAYGLALAARRGEPLERRGRPPAAHPPHRGQPARRARGGRAGPRPAPTPCSPPPAPATRPRSRPGAAIGGHGLALLRPGARVLTHCNAGWLAVQDWGTALAPVYRAARPATTPSST